MKRKRGGRPFPPMARQEGPERGGRAGRAGQVSLTEVLEGGPGGRGPKSFGDRTSTRAMRMKRGM